jgi:hypothetical protein
MTCRHAVTVQMCSLGKSSSSLPRCVAHFWHKTVTANGWQKAALKRSMESMHLLAASTVVSVLHLHSV